MVRVTLHSTDSLPPFLHSKAAEAVLEQARHQQFPTPSLLYKGVKIR